MRSYRLSDFERVTGGESVSNSPQISFSHLITDSRGIISPLKSLFFAIRGPNRDGHQYIPELYGAGVRHFVVEYGAIKTALLSVDSFPEANFLIVTDSVKALQQFASWQRDMFEGTVVAITGSNGKTIVKEWLYQMLFRKLPTVRSPKSYNSQIGVPLSLWQLSDQYQLGIFESGISMCGEMTALQQIINPKIGIFTNLGEAHQENFNDPAEKLAEKLILFKEAELLLCNNLNSWVKDEIDRRFPNKKVRYWGHDDDADLQLLNRRSGDSETLIEYRYSKVRGTIRIPFTDDASVENAMTVLLFLKSMGYDDKELLLRFSTLTPVAMRLEVIQGNKNCLIINDSYNSDLISLDIALKVLKNHKKHQKKTLILSDMRQINRDPEPLYREVAGMVNSSGLTKIIGIGKDIPALAPHITTPAQFFTSTEAMIKALEKLNFNNETILLKGAREFKFETLTALLQKKVHETVLEINLRGIDHNLAYYRSLLNKETKMMVMVKAQGYGSGSIEIAERLQQAGVDYLAVAYTDEGIELRKAGISLPIMVMNPEIENMGLMIDHHLEPELYNFRILTIFAAAVRSRRVNSFPVHLKIDTGMNRLGFSITDIPELLSALEENPELEIQSIFSHLASSDEAEMDSFTDSQIENFKEISSRISSRLGISPIRHILDTAGIERKTDAQFDMVRLGIGLYGIGTTHTEHLENVAVLKSSISQIRRVKKGERVGYAGEPIQHDTRIAIVPIGYADGFRRKLGNGHGCMYINGQKVPTIGNICMDMCMLNIATLSVKEGDEVIVFSTQSQLENLARRMETIPYEVLSSLSHRVKRIYYTE